MIIINESHSDDKVYVRFGDIPKNEKSNIYSSDEKVDEELGVSVWDSCTANDDYFPKLPDNPSEEAITDFFKLLYSDRPVYLVSGVELNHTGTDDEPLLKNIKIIKELNYDYLKGEDK